MDKPISRKRALALYRDALERGDFDTVAAVLWLAERDPKLVHMIAKFHERVDASAYLTADAKPRRGIIEVVRIKRDSSPDGWPPKPDQSEEEPNMFKTFVPARSPYYGGARKLRLDLIAWATGVLMMAVLGLVLLFMRAPEATMPEFASQPESCMAEDQNPQAESVRLAGEARALMDGEGDNTELAMLLGICALQTVYTREADDALQLSSITAQAISEFPGDDTGILNSALFSTDGRYLLVSYRNEVRLWDIGAGTELQTFLTLWGGPAALSPDGRYVLGTLQMNVARLWDTETGALVHDFNAGTEIIDLTFSPDGTRIALGLITGTVQIWRVDTATLERRVPLGYDIADVAFSPDGTGLLVSGDRNRPYPVHLLDVETGTELRMFTGLRDFANMAVFSPDGRYILAGGDTADRRALLWDAKTGEELRVFSGYTNDVNAVAFSPDSHYALVGSADSTAGLWDIETGTEVRRFGSVGSLGYVWSVGFSPDGKTILIGTSDGVVRLWPTDYRDMIPLACEHVTRDFTDEERAQYGLGEGAACP